MTTITLKILAGIESRLNTLLRIENGACGHEEEIQRANRQRDKLMKFVADEVEKLARKAGEV